ncbi:MAG: 3'-5' exonuclease [Deltaproteobacteria bacterium]|nr:3'-5' exonuclease [Deltaproteobacteria bacterium]
MKPGESCGCFPTGRHYPGIAHLVRVRSGGVVEELDPDAPWASHAIAFIDVETTGTDPASDRIVELAVVIGQGAEVRERASWLVNPGVPIPEQATKVHGYTDADVAGRPAFAEIVIEVADRLRGAIPAAYNAPFDRGFLVAELERAGIELDPLPPALRPEVEWLDPLVFARELHDQRQGGRSLGEVSRRLGIKLEQAHQATADAEAALQVLYAFGKDPRVPTGYAALVQEQRRLGRAQEQARRLWRKG